MGVSKKGEEEQKICTILAVYQQTPAASSKFIKDLCQFILRAEQEMMIEASSPFREVLMKCLLRYPGEAMDMFLEDEHVKVFSLFTTASQSVYCSKHIYFFQCQCQLVFTFESSTFFVDSLKSMRAGVVHFST